MPTISGQSRHLPVNGDPWGKAPRKFEAPQPKHSWSELPGHIVPSAVDLATGLWDMVTHPGPTAEGIIDAAQGTVDSVMPQRVTDFMDTYVSPRSAETKERQRQVSAALIKTLKDRYGSLENIRNTLITDPVGSAVDVAGAGGGALGLLRRPLSALAKSPVDGFFNPKPKPERPFVKDYPDGAEVGEFGMIAKDIEGRPLDAPYIAGRTRVDAPDHALAPIDVQRVGEYGIEGPIDKVPSNRLYPGYVGQTHLSYGIPTRVEVLDSLPKAEMDITTAHEVGHVIDALAGQIPTKGIESELDFNYSALRTGKERKLFLSRPEDFGYKNHHIGREKMAEAIRAYMVDPNYLKTVAPKTAARIREFVHNSPQLSKIIQFNTLAAGGALALGTAGQTDDSHAASRHEMETDGLAGLKQTLAGRGLYRQAPRSAMWNGLIRALAARAARPKIPQNGPSH